MGDHIKMDLTKLHGRVLAGFMWVSIGTSVFGCW